MVCHLCARVTLANDYIIVNQNPTAYSDTFSINENDAPTILGVLSNDTAYPDVGETLTITSATELSCTSGRDSTASSTYANLTLVNPTTVRFSPLQYFWGTCTFNYGISDGNGGIANSSAVVTVNFGNYRQIFVIGI